MKKPDLYYFLKILGIESSFKYLYIDSLLSNRMSYKNFIKYYGGNSLSIYIILIDRKSGHPIKYSFWLNIDKLWRQYYMRIKYKSYNV